MEKAVQIRHGDVLLTRIGPPVKRKNATGKKVEVVVAEGELTGHAHRVLGVDVDLEGSKLNVPFGAEISHEEHHLRVLEPGMYEKRNQVELTEVGMRRVLD